MASKEEDEGEPPPPAAAANLPYPGAPSPEAIVEQLVGMGIGRDMAMSAVRATNALGAEAAMEYIFGDDDDLDSDDDDRDVAQLEANAAMRLAASYQVGGDLQASAGAASVPGQVGRHALWEGFVWVRASPPCAAM